MAHAGVLIDCTVISYKSCVCYKLKNYKLSCSYVTYEDTCTYVCNYGVNTPVVLQILLHENVS